MGGDGARMHAAFREQCGVKCLTLTGRNHRTADADPHAAYVTPPVPRCCSGVIGKTFDHGWVALRHNPNFRSE